MPQCKKFISRVQNDLQHSAPYPTARGTGPNLYKFAILLEALKAALQHDYGISATLTMGSRGPMFYRSMRMGESVTA
jgi:hypothetical protein